VRIRIFEHPIFAASGIGTATDHDAVDIPGRIRRRHIDYCSSIARLVQVVPQLGGFEVRRVVKNIHLFFDIEVIEPIDAQFTRILPRRIALPVRHGNGREVTVALRINALLKDGFDIR
jgi:hypothetical protein